MRKVVYLHGPLREKWPEPFVVEADTPAEAINAFCKQTKVLNPAPGQHRPVFQVVGYNDPRLLFLPNANENEEIHLVPACIGGAKGGFLQILVGAALIAAAFIPGLQGVTLPVLGSMSSMFLSMGIKFVLSGLMMFLSPAPSLDSSPSDQDPEPSKYLGAPGNTVKIGTRIPILYGEVKVGGHYLSFDIDAKDTSKGEVVSNSGGLGGEGSTIPRYAMIVTLVDSVFNGGTGQTTWTITLSITDPDLPGNGDAYEAEWFSTGGATMTKKVTYTPKVGPDPAKISFVSSTNVLADMPALGSTVDVYVLTPP